MRGSVGWQETVETMLTASGLGEMVVNSSCLWSCITTWPGRSGACALKLPGPAKGCPRRVLLKRPTAAMIYKPGALDRHQGRAIVYLRPQAPTPVVVPQGLLRARRTHCQTQSQLSPLHDTSRAGVVGAAGAAGAAAACLVGCRCAWLRGKGPAGQGSHGRGSPLGPAERARDNWRSHLRDITATLGAALPSSGLLPSSFTASCPHYRPFYALQCPNAPQNSSRCMSLRFRLEPKPPRTHCRPSHAGA